MVAEAVAAVNFAFFNKQQVFIQYLLFY